MIGQLFSGVLLGWGLGANDSANVFGTAVSSRMVKYSTAVILASIAIILGAMLQGHEGMETIKSLSNSDITSGKAIATATASALAVVILTLFKLPISTSQAVVGSIIGGAIFSQTLGDGSDSLNFSSLTKVVICWFATPIGGFLFSLFFYNFFKKILDFFKPTMITTDTILRIGLILSGCYGAYALGANNVANVTGVYYASGMLTIFNALALGSFSIAIGVITYSKNVMMTVGKGIIPLDPFSALVTVVAHAVTVHIFAIIGVPVSTSQAIVGAVIGVGVIKNIEAINKKVILKVFSGWFVTPILSSFLAFVILVIMNTSIGFGS